MKFEIDLNELTTDQRDHVAAFITGWPTLAFTKMNNDIHLPRNSHIVEEDEHGVKFIIPTEEQRLDDEQKSDLEETTAVKLNAIFGTPDVVMGTPPYHTVPLDKEGLPWDSRVHSSSKARLVDGTWKLRRGVDPADVENVKAQLKELMAVPTAPSHVPVPPAPVVIPQLAEIVPPISGVPVPPAPKPHYLIDQQPPTGYVVPQTQVDRAYEVDIEKEAVEQYAAKNTITLTDLIGRMSAAIAAGKLTQANIAEICVKHGVSEFHLLSNRPDLLPLIDDDMKAIGV